MTTFGITNENGNRVKEETFSKKAVMNRSSGEFQPSVVQSVKYDNKGQMSSITSECGETENRRQGNNKANITVEGIISENEVDAIKSLKAQEELRLETDIFGGDVIVERASISQSDDLNWIEVGGDRELAFKFQVQFKEP